MDDPKKINFCSCDHCFPSLLSWLTQEIKNLSSSKPSEFA
ncbi:hypothetical protein GCW_00100 [Mycoplasmoides gallisepticum S6]|uniref:Uncharacterized protein n=1 Tax=Mycoplasmoides gallisepticum S6 TaxID=1006581 RepID=A0A0F6CLK1_MYCGL|nr:hypothetical protein GCW_00100 [Mycoplasmoides gallisepticum S6]